MMFPVVAVRARVVKRINISSAISCVPALSISISGLLTDRVTHVTHPNLGPLVRLSNGRKIQGHALPVAMLNPSCAACPFPQEARRGEQQRILCSRFRLIISSFESACACSFPASFPALLSDWASGSEQCPWQHPWSRPWTSLSCAHCSSSG